MISLAAPAPAFAASGTCAGFAFPAMPSSGTSGNGWTRTVSGTVQSNGTNGFSPGPSHQVSADPTAGASAITAAVSVPLAAGRTYTFSIPYQKFGGNARRQTCEFQIDGVTRTGGLIDSDIGPDYTTQTLTVTFRATTSRLHVVSFVHRFAASSASNVGDDIGVASPTVTCT